MVAEVLAGAAAEHFTDTATLLTSELVTNGIVHAHTDLEVVVDATPTWVRVEVVDGNPQMPVRREYDEFSSTGRGMEMVELLADDFGVEQLEDHGKRVWFRLGVVPGTPDPTTAAAAHAAAADAAAPTQVQLLGVPIMLYCAWQQHAEALLREATLVAFEDTDETGTEHNDYPLAGGALAALADAAGGLFEMRDLGVGISDVDLGLPTDTLSWFPILSDLLAKATAMAVSQQLLTPPSLPEIVAVRRWVCDEIARQSAGLLPTPWIEHVADEPRPTSASEDLRNEVRHSALARVAADAANHIVAVSGAAAELLGWEADQLEGRRLVTIIPPRLRDKHIAGFTRHLLEGSSRMLGHPVAVPALRRDGREVDVEMLVERWSVDGTRGLFIATLTPR